LARVLIRVHIDYLYLFVNSICVSIKVQQHRVKLLGWSCPRSAKIDANKFFNVQKDIRVLLGSEAINKLLAKNID
jgi:hypothetical protein